MKERFINPADLKGMIDSNEKAGTSNLSDNEYGCLVQDRASQFFWLFIKMAFIVILLIINFTSLSIALNCNKNASVGTKTMAALFAFFFGFIYLFVNYYSYRLLTRKQICEFDQNRLFPF